MTNKELIKTYKTMCKKLKVKSFYPFWFPKSYLKMKLIKGVKVNV
jgi:hypothetical protein